VLGPVVDERYLGSLDGKDPLFGVRSPEGARAVLTTIAGSMITIASLTFSITIVALTLASSQFGSRLLYNFMRDRANQVVLGIFSGSFIYCLLVLRAIRTSSGADFIPHASLLGAVGAALASIAVLIFFIHHVAESIQADTVVSNVSHELQDCISRFFPEDCDEEQEDGEEVERIVSRARGRGIRIHARRDGIVQAIDMAGIRACATANDVEIVLECRPGHYVIEGAVVARVVPSLEDAAAASIQSAFVTGHRRTLVQDAEFALQQLVEVAVRALSPGINDPMTAMRCIDELSAGLAKIMVRADLPRIVRDDGGRARIVRDAPDFAGLLSAAFNQIRQHGERDLAVTIRLLDRIRDLIPFARKPSQLPPLLRQAKMAYDAAIKSVDGEDDRADLTERFESILRLAGRRRSSPAWVEGRGDSAATSPAG
jgi:uncharacterized membrane protein